MRLISEGGLPPRAVKRVVAANTRLLALTLETKGVTPSAEPEGEIEDKPDGEPEAAWEDDGEWPSDPNKNAMVDPAKAIGSMNANLEKSARDVPDEGRTLVPHPLALKPIRQWAQSQGARTATAPRRQQRG